MSTVGKKDIKSSGERKSSSKRKKESSKDKHSHKKKDSSVTSSSKSRSSHRHSSKTPKEVESVPVEEEEEYLLADDDELYLEDGDDMDTAEVDCGLADSFVREKTWNFLSCQQFLDELLETSLQDIGPYVPFIDNEDTELVSWKCLNILRALNWNIGRVEEVLDKQDKIFKAAGILEEPKKMLKEKSKITCSVCEESVKVEKTSSMECRHRFCNDCWNGTISAEISASTYQQLFGNLNCMHRSCNCTILGNLVKKVVSDKDWQHYIRMLVKSYLEVNSSTYSQCPNSSCGKIAKANYKSRISSKVVQCKCGDSYCFNCNMAPHIPASCRDLERWRAKDADDEASTNFIKATTSQCPKCGRALDRITACNHITCGCGHQFCFVCKGNWGSCSVYRCSKYKTVEEQEKNTGKDFAPGFKTSSEWLVQHERFVAFSKKYINAKQQHDKVLKWKSTLLEKSLNYREEKPGGNPQFIIDGWEVLLKSWNILQYTFVWGFFNIPPTICAQKNIYEWQIKNYEKLLGDLYSALNLPVASLDHLKTKHLYTLIESNLIKKIEDAQDLLALFSEKAIGKVESQSVLARWTCPACNYSNHPVEQEKSCGYCQKARPEVKIVWFGSD
eukprot:TRINITY_DN2803_c0_g1_i1.p1 TRINITY_DN2803_c0_g1~~TRINITY_DN2803_c0_g1_i1.p1  ORF type:complete len:616 (+),score=131.37 TRINITY_DN2803_c0_g1_i1:1825-3672(+)